MVETDLWRPDSLDTLKSRLTMPRRGTVFRTRQTWELVGRTGAFGTRDANRGHDVARLARPSRLFMVGSLGSQSGILRHFPPSSLDVFLFPARCNRRRNRRRNMSFRESHRCPPGCCTTLASHVLGDSGKAHVGTCGCAILLVRGFFMQPFKIQWSRAPSPPKTSLVPLFFFSQ